MEPIPKNRAGLNKDEQKNVPKVNVRWRWETFTWCRSVETTSNRFGYLSVKNAQDEYLMTWSAPKISRNLWCYCLKWYSNFNVIKSYFIHSYPNRSRFHPYVSKGVIIELKYRVFFTSFTHFLSFWYSSLVESVLSSFFLVTHIVFDSVFLFYLVVFIWNYQLYF